MRREAMKVLAKISSTPAGRKVKHFCLRSGWVIWILFSSIVLTRAWWQGFVDSGLAGRPAEMVLVQDFSLTEAVCQCVAGLVMEHAVLQQFLRAGVVASLLEVLADPIHDGDTMTAAVNALHEILQRDDSSCKTVVESGKMVRNYTASLLIEHWVMEHLLEFEVYLRSIYEKRFPWNGRVLILGGHDPTREVVSHI